MERIKRIAANLKSNSGRGSRRQIGNGVDLLQI